MPFGRGAFAARGAVMGANAVLAAAQRLRSRILAHAADVAAMQRRCAHHRGKGRSSIATAEAPS